MLLLAWSSAAEAADDKSSPEEEEAWRSTSGSKVSSKRLRLGEVAAEEAIVLEIGEDKRDRDGSVSSRQVVSVSGRREGIREKFLLLSRNTGWR